MSPPVLAVDDEPDVLASLLELLGPVAPLRSASCGAEALRLVAAERPRVMLLDVGMPRMGGLAVLRRARLLDPCLHVIMLTGRRDLSLARRALDEGARSFVTKPFEGDVLRDEVRRCLERVPPSPSYRPWRVRA